MRLVEILVGLSAVGSIATFLGVRAAVRRTLRTLGRKPPSPSEDLEQEIERRRA